MFYGIYIIFRLFNGIENVCWKAWRKSNVKIKIRKRCFMFKWREVLDLVGKWKILKFTKQKIFIWYFIRNDCSYRQRWQRNQKHKWIYRLLFAMNFKGVSIPLTGHDFAEKQHSNAQWEEKTKPKMLESTSVANSPLQSFAYESFFI